MPMSKVGDDICLLAAGLVDELHLMIGPSFLGGGTPVFEGGSPVRLRLLEARPMKGGELVLVRHGIAGGEINLLAAIVMSGKDVAHAAASFFSGPGGT
jgi:hypothetical protein